MLACRLAVCTNDLAGYHVKTGMFLPLRCSLQEKSKEYHAVSPPGVVSCTGWVEIAGSSLPELCGEEGFHGGWNREWIAKIPASPGELMQG